MTTYLNDQNTYLGAKGASGLYQAIINIIPPHNTYVEPFLGTGQIMKRKAEAVHNIGYDLNPKCIKEFNSEINVELVEGCGIKLLESNKFDSETVCYIDPPYPMETRTCRKSRYEYDIKDEDHQRILTAIKKSKANIIISSYKNDMYDKALKKWWKKEIPVNTKGGVRKEIIWANFIPSDLHWHTFVGENFTDRQRIKRKAERWKKNFKALPQGERQAVLAAILSVED